MPAIQYPDTLPVPSLATLEAFERRVFTAGTGPRVDRAVQYEWLATQDLEFRFTAAEAEIFHAWWEEQLLLGGAWFSAVWPLPQGLIEAARKFTGAMRWQTLAAEVFVVKSQSEVRGTGELPQSPAAGGQDIGWLDPIDGEDRTSASIANEGAPQNSSWWEFMGRGALAPYPENPVVDEFGDPDWTGWPAVVFSVAWVPVIGGQPAPSITGYGYGGFTLTMQPGSGPGTNLAAGVATITATIGGVPAIGYLTMTASEPTFGGYGNISWEHHVGSPP